MELEFKTQAKIRSQENLIRSIPQPGLQELSLETISGTLKRKAVTTIAIREPAYVHLLWLNFSGVLAFRPITATSSIHVSVERFKKLELQPGSRSTGFLNQPTTAAGIFRGAASGSKQPFPGNPVIPQ